LFFFCSHFHIGLALKKQPHSILGPDWGLTEDREPAVMSGSRRLGRTKPAAFE
jgi:hypothetical protein